MTKQNSFSIDPKSKPTWRMNPNHSPGFLFWQNIFHDLNLNKERSGDLSVMRMLRRIIQPICFIDKIDKMLKSNLLKRSAYN